jgi:hypothetical protein
MKNGSSIIKNKFIKYSQDSIVVESGAKEIHAFVLAQKNKLAPDAEITSPAEQHVEEDHFLYEERL